MDRYVLKGFICSFFIFLSYFSLGQSDKNDMSLPGFNVLEHDYLKDEKIPRPDFSVISNNEGYGVETPRKKGVILKGAQLGLHDGAPIGYNIYLPKRADALLIYIYGGFQREDREKKIYRPQVKLSRRNRFLFRSLLHNNVAVAELNLPDLLKLDSHQRYMSSSLHQLIHRAIHKFIIQIREHPERLHQTLSSLWGKKLFLFGASFGGRTAVRHAELYPYDIDGVISHDGSLSYSMKRRLRGEKIARHHLRPETYRHMRSIKAPVLILQNFDDRKIHPSIAIDFYRRMKSLGKRAQLYFTERASPISEHCPKNNPDGHYLTVYDDLAQGYMGIIVRFIFFGPEDSAISDWRAYAYSKHANKNLEISPLEHRRVSNLLHDFINASFSKKNEKSRCCDDSDKKLFADVNLFLRKKKKQDKESKRITSALMKTLKKYLSLGGMALLSHKVGSGILSEREHKELIALLSAYE